MRLSIVCLELGFIWLVYYAYGVATAHDMSIWLTTTLVIAVDRIVTWITTAAERRRRRLAEGSHDG